MLHLKKKIAFRITKSRANSEHTKIKVIFMMNTVGKTKQAKNCSFLKNCLLEP